MKIKPRNLDIEILMKFFDILFEFHAWMTAIFGKSQRK